MTDDDDQQRELFKTTKSVKKNSKDSHHYFQSLCNIHLFEGKFEYQNGCEVAAKTPATTPKRCSMAYHHAL